MDGKNEKGTTGRQSERLGSADNAPKVHYGVNHGMWFFVIFNLDGGSYENEQQYLWKKNAVRAAKQKCAEIGIPYVCGSVY